MKRPLLGVPAFLSLCALLLTCVLELVARTLGTVAAARAGASPLSGLFGQSLVQVGGAQVPVWHFIVVFAVLPACWLAVHLSDRRRDRRYRRAGLCRSCGYNLRATAGQCPECGSVNEARTAARTAACAPRSRLPPVIQARPD
jgi:hypothetical protein